MPSSDTQYKKGHRQSAEIRKKLSLARLGKKLSLETRKKMSESSKGRKKHPLSQETRKKMSLARMGKSPWNKGMKGFRLGVKMSEEIKRKISEAQKGEKGHNWKGGSSTINMRIRMGLEYRLWRTAVFQRDNYTCIWCGVKNGNGKTIVLNADHIKPFAHYPELRFAIDNGRTLCVKCHKKTDNFGSKGIKNSRPKQDVKLEQKVVN